MRKVPLYKRRGNTPLRLATPYHDLLRPTTPPSIRVRREVPTLPYDLLRPITTYYIPSIREEGSAHSPLQLATPYHDLLQPTTHHSRREKESAHSPTPPFIREKATPYHDRLRPTTHHSMREKGSVHSPTPCIREGGNAHAPREKEEGWILAF